MAKSNKAISQHIEDEYFNFFQALAYFPRWKLRNEDTYTKYKKRMLKSMFTGETANEIVYDFFKDFADVSLDFIAKYDVRSVILAKNTILDTVNKERNGRGYYTGRKIKCSICGKMAEASQDDHILPVDVVGVDYYPEYNHQPTCENCNRVKGNTIYREDVVAFLNAINIHTMVKEAA